MCRGTPLANRLGMNTNFSESNLIFLDQYLSKRDDTFSRQSSLREACQGSIRSSWKCGCASSWCCACWPPLLIGGWHASATQHERTSTPGATHPGGPGVQRQRPAHFLIPPSVGRPLLPARMNIPESSSVPGRRRGFDPAPAAETMDVARSPRIAQQRRRQRWIGGGIAALALAGVTLSLAHLRPAVPTIERSTIWTDTVRRGPMIRQVRGMGTLVPEEIRWIAAGTDARIERIVVYPRRDRRTRHPPARPEQPGIASERPRRRRRRDRRPGPARQPARATRRPVARTAGRLRQGRGRPRHRRRPGRGQRAPLQAGARRRRSNSKNRRSPPGN